tara:strand:- start:10144 stop:10755 length:612 start_codon:yes stop_codon:yes gene_type:complete
MNTEDTTKNITGHLEIVKVTKDGQETTVHDDHNIIVSGMGVMLTSLFGGGGSKHLTDHQMTVMQVGCSGNTEASTLQVLGQPLSSVERYGADSKLVLADGWRQIVDGVPVTGDAVKPFVWLPFSKITLVNDNSVRATLTIDEDACNGLVDEAGRVQTINEIGLFAFNIDGQQPPAPIMVAYKKFSNQLKSSDHSLVFRWTINF